LCALYETVNAEKGVNQAELEEARNQRAEMEAELNETKSARRAWG